MKKIISISIIFLVALSVFAKNGPEKFEIKFEKGKTLNYHTISIIDMTMVMNIMGTNQEIEMKIDLYYDIALTPLEFLDNGSTKLLLEPGNIKAHWEMNQAGMPVIMDLEGEEIIATSNGTVFIDTENGIGEIEAESIMVEMKGLYESGEIEITPQGNIGTIEGSEDFESFWKENIESTIGFFGIIFSEDKVKMNETWQVPFSLSHMGEIQLNKDLNFEVDFEWAGSKNENGKEYQIFKGSSPYDATGVKGIMGDAASELELDINKFQRTASFEILFDQERGLVVDNKTIIEGKAEMSTDIEGSSMTMDMIMKATMDIQLIE
jgi:hypothetical protein